MKKTGGKFSEEGFDALWLQFDSSGDGSIDEAEMIDFVKKLLGIDKIPKPGEKMQSPPPEQEVVEEQKSPEPAKKKAGLGKSPPKINTKLK